MPIQQALNSSAPIRSLSRQEVRSVDQRAISELGLPGIVLMENAGRGAAELLLKLGPRGRVVVCAGKGNNGGDGFVIARHLENHGVEVRVLCFAEPPSSQRKSPESTPRPSDFETNVRIAVAAGMSVRFMPPGAWLPTDIDAEFAGAAWIVDALLGTGTSGEIRPPLATVIERINAAGAPVLAVDLPSGLDCDTGRPLGPCVKATHTATFVARKIGFDAPGSLPWTGAVHIVDIGVPRAWLHGLFPA